MIFGRRHKLAQLLTGSALAMLTVVAGASAQVADGNAQASGSTVPSGAASSAEAPAENGVNDIIVTAQKRSESINRVGMSITAESGAALAEKGIQDAADLVKVVPGFNFTPSSYGAPVYTLRGVGFYDVSLSAATAVNVYVDEVPLPYSILTTGASLDLERVEVLKGPQGTLFGGNSTGGAINYIAAKPTSTFVSGADLSFGRFADLKVSGFSSGPLTSNLNARIAASYERADPWQRSYTRDAQLGKVDIFVARLLLDWRPTDTLKISVNLNGWHDGSDNQAGQLIAVFPNARTPAAVRNYPLAPQNAQAADWTVGGAFGRDNRFYQGTLRADLELGATTTLTAIGSYEHLNRVSSTDADGTNQREFDVSTPGKADIAFAEMRLTGNGDRFKWVVGANYQYENSFDDIVGDGSQGSLPFLDAATRGQQTVNTYAGFANVTYQLVPTVSLQAGARYTKQDRSYVGCLYDTGSGSLARFISGVATARSGQTVVVPPGGCGTLGVNSLPTVDYDQLNEDNVSWRVGVNWQATSSALLYANVSRGYKAGAFPSIAATSILQLAPARQEALTAYEAGFKLGLAHRTLQLNGAVFYYDYSDKQFRGKRIDPSLGAFNALINVPKSSITGAELEAAWRPVTAFTMTLGATYIDTKIKDNFTNYDPYGSLTNFNGEPFPLTPKWQLTGDAEYRLPLTERLTGYIGVGGTYQSRTNAGLGELPLLNIKAYGLLDARLGVRRNDGRWSAGLFVRNLTDTYYWTYVSTTDPVTTVRLAAKPRTYGVSASFRF